MSASTQNLSLLVLTIPLPCQRGHKIYLNCVDQSFPMPAMTQYASQITK